MAKSKITDMTVGSPSKHLLTFAVPPRIRNLFQQFYNMVDSLIVGNFVGANALAAVGTCGSLNFFFFSLTSGLAIGIGIIASQYFGAKDEKSLKTTIANSYYVLAIASVIVSTLGYIFSGQILKLMQCPPSIFYDAKVYLRTTCLGIIFIAFYNGTSSILRALGDSKTPLFFLILSSIINVVLDLLFVLKLNLGVFGVGLATIIAQAISSITSFSYAIIKNPFFKLSKTELRPHTTIIARSFKLGTPIAAQGALIAISCIVLQGVVNSFGEIIMAAYTVTGRIEQLVQMPYQSLGSALTTFSGQNIGAGNLERVKKGMHRGTVIALIFSIALIPVFYIFGDDFVYLFVKDMDVVRIGHLGLKLTCLFYFELGMIYVPRAVLNGCGDANFAMMNGICEVLCRILYSQILVHIASITLFKNVIPIGFWGIWITTALTWLTTSIFCIIRYKSGIWKTKGIVQLKK